MDVTDPAFSGFLSLFQQSVQPLPVNDTVMSEIAQASELRQIDKMTHLNPAGHPVGYIFFIYTGIIRYYYLDEMSGDEHTGQFFEEGMIYTDAASFFRGTPSDHYIQALSPCEILMIPRAVIANALDQDHALERFGRLMMEQALVGSQRRTANMLSGSLDDRYRSFIASRPSVARRIPQYVIASYLGVTPEALARSRRRSTLSTVKDLLP